MHVVVGAGKEGVLAEARDKGARALANVVQDPRHVPGPQSAAAAHVVPELEKELVSDEVGGHRVAIAVQHEHDKLGALQWAPRARDAGFLVVKVDPQAHIVCNGVRGHFPRGWVAGVEWDVSGGASKVLGKDLRDHLGRDW